MDERIQMRNFRLGFMCLLTALLVAFVAGCGQETVTIPFVMSVTPTQGAKDVPITTNVTATFSQAMNPASITPTTFTLAGPGGVAVAGAASSPSYSGVTATFTPAVALAFGTTYTATITTGVATPGGAALMGNYVWSFTTLAASIPSVVIKTVTPTPFSQNVPLTGPLSIISATFSEAMTAATTDAAFTVEAQGGVALPGKAVLNAAGTLATFTPTSGTLAYSTTYTATITTGATSLAEGMTLAGNYVWTFTTLAPGIPFVSLVSPAQGLANVAVDAPITATFSIPMSPASVNGTTTFTVYAPNGVPVPGNAVLTGGTLATFTPTSGTLDYKTTYTATITTAATSVGGYPIVANYVWTFTTIAQGIPAVVPPPSPLPFASGVSLTSATAPISVTFSQPMNCASLQTAFTVKAPTGDVAVTSATPAVTCVLNGSGNTIATFMPAGGALPSYSTTYTATIGATATDTAGTALAGAYVWTFTTLAQGIPFVSSVTPTQGHPNVAVNAPIQASFSPTVPMSPVSMSAGTFTVYAPNGVQVPGNAALNAAGTLATFTPTSNGGLLAYGTTYTATIAGGTTTPAATSSVGGVPIVANYVWSFTTITAAPMVTATDPVTPSTVAPIVAEEVAVPLNQVITATFSELMDPTTIIGANFTLTWPSGTQSGTVSYISRANQLVFLPSSGGVPVNLLPDTEYTATITGGPTGVMDVAGTALQVTAPMVTNYTWNFHTVAGTSTKAPYLVKTVPGDTAVGVQAVNVPITQAINATFNEGMNTQTLFGTSTSPADFYVYLTSDATKTPLAGKYSYDPTSFIATFAPTNPLTAGDISYTATVVGATDLFGNVLVDPSPTPLYPNTWTFTTGTAAVQPVVLGPTITPFGGFGGSAGMTNSGISTVVNGDIGTTASSTLITGFHDDTVLPVVSAAGSTVGCTYTEVANSDIGLVTGEIYTNTPPPTIGCPDEGTPATMAIATEALAEAKAAYLALQSTTASTDPGNAPQGITLANTELGTLALTPGVYWSQTTVKITSGDLTLDAQGDPSATWVFQVGSALTVGEAGNPRSVILKNGAKASNIFWVCGSAATINGAGGGTFNGTIIASSGAISTGTAGTTTITTINGRLISLVASTTLVDTVINVPTP
jgi:hypothetical protein